MTAVRIGDRLVGAGCPCLVIAEAGVNHNGSGVLAHKLVDLAARAGADAVKFQTFSADRLASRSAPKAAYQRDTTGTAESQYDMLRRLELSPEIHRELVDHCRQSGLMFLSTPFDEASVDLLDGLGVPAFKMSSGEITNVSLLRHVAAKGKPIIMSTGMSTLAEVQSAVGVLGDAGASQVVLLHCVSRYPADPAEANLRAMRTMADATSLPVGYSDHTMGIEVALTAVALGAVVLEKHFTSSRALAGPDHRCSLEPAELTKLVHGVRAVESALGHGRKEPTEGEAAVAAVARRSLVAARAIPAGTVLTEDLITSRRPGTGLPPDMLPRVLGRRVRMAVDAGTLLTLDLLT